jgi:hypothetical protein
MKKYIIILFTFIGSFANAQLDFQVLCLECAEQNGFYCGDDPSNWTQYSPNGCVQTSWINDGWVDCVDASDEGEDVVPTLPLDCIPPPPLCDTVYVDVPVYIYETIFQTDTIYNTEYITQIVFDTIVEIEYETIFEEIFITDTLYMEGALDTMFITTDTIIEYVEIINTEYLDCDTGLPCTSNIQEIIDQSKKENKFYNLLGQVIKEPNGIYIEDGQIKYKLK